MNKKIQISLRLTEQEKEILDRYCEQEGRQQSELIREFIRGLKVKLKSRRETTGF
jgi:predicted DNA-binding protein